MTNRWNEREAARMVERYGPGGGEMLALRTYASRLLGADPALVLHGGGNTSLKAEQRSALGDRVPAIFVKASGFDMATIEPEGHPALDLTWLRRFRALDRLPDDEMVNQLRRALFDSNAPTPSIETLVHAFLPGIFVDHTHADAVLALTNQRGGGALVREAFGDDVAIIDYVEPGFLLAKAAAAAVEGAPAARGLVLLKHGLMTWGDTARACYDAQIDLVARAEAFLAARSRKGASVTVSRTAVAEAWDRLGAVGPIIRGQLARRSGSAEPQWDRVVLAPLINDDVLGALDQPGARDALVTPPLTADHLIRTRSLPLWFDTPAWDDLARFKNAFQAAVQAYSTAYESYLARHRAALPGGLETFAPLPRVVLLPGVGAICAGQDEQAAAISRDITAQTLQVKRAIAAMGAYEGLSERQLFEMEYRGLQHAKLAATRGSLAGRVALITGAAGAIGAGIAQGLLEEDCHVVVTDLPGERLDSLAADLSLAFPGRASAVPMDVTDEGSVAGAFRRVASGWGGVDLVIINAGIAHVSPLMSMDVDAFRRLERVNIDGTLLVLAASGRHFAQQGTGGDIVLVSTKNVFAPGAKFGAYSATKAASHQLGRIASLELADDDVRVNMVSPDAVFGHGTRRSGLWAEVGPDRMKARGLDEAGLEEYYRTRNLLKARVTARHVANAVLYFATRQSPTTGATIPVDGGLPDATPR
jgi:rhamnose utilization protein RhaD (predicted bifunctional aldolase and dehydrogenase)/NAD(P)-dependent dehydrogenase (short-subunit alcohol dehydrogenase family)